MLFGLSATAQIAIPEGHYKVETDANPVIICNVWPNNLAGPYSTITLGATVYNFQSPVSAIQRNTEYIVLNGGNSYRLFFSIIAMVDIQVDAGFNSINSDDEIRGDISVMDTVGIPYSSIMAIKHRGASSLTYPKKSYRVQLKNASFKNKNESIFGLRSDKRWLMLALYNERLRINNKVCHDLWLDMHKLYYLDQEPEALSTIRSRYVLVFVDNKYRGLYLFTEDVDAKQYKLKEDEGNEEDKDYGGGDRRYTGGELYKGDDNGAPNFFNHPFSVPALPAYGTEVWSNWEIKLPDVSDWNNLREFSRQVRDTETSVLQSAIWSSLHKENFIDYYLYINLVYAEDNLGKNLFMGKYKKGEPYFYGVWDLDGTLGFQYNSSRNPRGEGLIENHLWSKLLQGNVALRDSVAIRWFTLRRGKLSNSELLARIQKQYDYLNTNGAYSLESIVQSRTPVEVVHGGWDRTWFNSSSGELNYMKDFLAGRLETMDALLEPWLSSPLPVTLNSFVATSRERQVELSWQTSKELNFDRFEVAHSRDAVSWEKVGVVMAGGTAEASAIYRFMHHLGVGGTHYYRLKMIDQDGSFTNSKIVSVSLEGEREINIYPNPAKGVLHIKTSGLTKPGSFSLYDLLGRAVLNKPVLAGDTDHALDVSLLKGLYLLRARFEDGTESVQRVLIK